MVKQCKICGKLIKRSGMIYRVYPKDYDYDFDCCNECNAKAVIISSIIMKIEGKILLI